MSLLNKLFARENPNLVMKPLYDGVVAAGRQTNWYERGEVPDTLDGRFDMIAAILSVVLIRLEQDPACKKETAWLTELFVSDMDGQLRQIGIGDMIVGKHIGKMMGALGGRLGAYRDALTAQADLGDALVRNLYRGEAPGDEALDYVTAAIKRLHSGLEKMDAGDIVAGQLPTGTTGA